MLMISIVLSRFDDIGLLYFWDTRPLAVLLRDTATEDRVA